ncbi:MAG: tetratricopeptide repeat protein [Azospirillum sp.]|nr:tetratricopeptide repeat protein [Azospirillum sp.]
MHSSNTPSAAETLLAQAMDRHRAGDFGAAHALYESAERLSPDDPAIPHLRGVLLHQTGRGIEGLAAIDRAIAMAPAIAPYHFNRANVLIGLGRADAARAAAEHALALDPTLRPAAAFLLSEALARGAYEDARARAAAMIQAPDADAQAWLGYALAGHALGDAHAAIPAYRQALALAPGDTAAINGLGAALLDTGAAQAARALLESAGDRAWGPLQANLGNARRATGDLEGAILALRRAAELEPANAATQANLGAALSEAGRLGEAIAACRAALAADPAHAPARSNLAAALFDTGAVAQARAEWDALPDDPVAGSNALYARLFEPAIDGPTALAAARAWAARHCPAPTGVPAPRGTGGRLRVGFVSPDLRSHSVAWFLLPYLAARARDGIELFAYAELAAEDAVTARLKPGFDAWFETTGRSADEIARRIAQDRIDVLVDLAGHTAGNRLDVFARRPAAVQASWLGYPDPTGLATIDWRLTDALAEPEEGPAKSPEAPWRLADGIHCYALPPGAPEPVARLDRTEGVVFGSFNNWPKHSGPCLDLWAEILRAVPGSRLVLKSRAFADAAVRDGALARFERAGVAGTRLELRARLDDPRAHLAAYAGIDVALDPFPYNGVTTTCEALAMGVPVVTLAGVRPAGRMGVALLTRAGHPEWIARDRADYIRIAVALAGDAAGRDTLRMRLRSALLASPVGDAKRFAAALDGAFAAMTAAKTAG